jgi:hypothetical protein
MEWRSSKGQVADCKALDVSVVYSGGFDPTEGE